MFSIIFTQAALKQLKKIVKKDKAVNKVMKEKFTALQRIKFKDAIKSGQIKIVEGISNKIINSLVEKDYEPFVYEYRNFPKQYPYRIYFVKRENALIILRILHHQDIKNKLAEQLITNIKENIFKG